MARSVAKNVPAPGERSCRRTSAPSPLMSSPERFINRELSWLEFNRRVLEEAANPNHPLLERLRFLSISANNLDEFFMVRVAGLVGQVLSGVTEISDGRPHAGRAARAHRRAGRRAGRVAAGAMARTANGAHGQRYRHSRRRRSDAPRKRLAAGYFLQQVFPILTPLAVDPAHPFPFIPNLGFTLALELLNPQDGRAMSALVRLPGSVERFIRLPDGPLGVTARFVSLDRLIVAFIGLLFPGYRSTGRRLISGHPRQRHRGRGRGRGPRPPL